MYILSLDQPSSAWIDLELSKRPSLVPDQCSLPRMISKAATDKGQRHRDKTLQPVALVHRNEELSLLSVYPGQR